MLKGGRGRSAGLPLRITGYALRVPHCETGGQVEGTFKGQAGRPRCGLGLSGCRDGGAGLTDLAGVDNFSGPRRRSIGGGAGGAGGRLARGVAAQQMTTTPIVPPRRTRSANAPLRDEKGFRVWGRRRRTRRSTVRRRMRSGGCRTRCGSKSEMFRPPRNASNSNNNRIRNHRTSTVNATAPLTPPAAVVVCRAAASSMPPVRGRNSSDSSSRLSVSS